jgi:hypothetical protein
MPKDFDELLLACIDDALTILGEDGKGVVLWLWESKSGLGKQKIPSHIEIFSSIIEDTFGQGAVIIESQIISEIKRSFGLHDSDITVLNDAVCMAKEKFTRKNQKSNTFSS